MRNLGTLPASRKFWPPPTKNNSVFLIVCQLTVTTRTYYLRRLLKCRATVIPPLKGKESNPARSSLLCTCLRQGATNTRTRCMRESTTFSVALVLPVLVFFAAAVASQGTSRAIDLGWSFTRLRPRSCPFRAGRRSRLYSTQAAAAGTFSQAPDNVHFRFSRDGGQTYSGLNPRDRWGRSQEGSGRARRARP